MNENTTEGQPRTIDRRTVVKGAAWSVPAIAAAVAMPLAAASDLKASLAISDGCFQVAGVGLLPGFRVTNSGTDAYTKSITIVETIDLSAIKLDLGSNNGILSSTARSVLWATLVVQNVAGLLEGASSGVTVGSWTGSDGTAWVGTGIFASSYKKATRTVTIPAGLAAGSSGNWGQLLSINLSQLLGGSWTAAITDPTGNPPVTTGTANLPFQILGGC